MGAIIFNTKPKHQNKPRLQQNLWSLNLKLFCLLVLTATFFILTLYDILQANKKLFHIGVSPFWSVNVLDTSTAATLFIAMLSALLVYHQFAFSLRPRINYKSAKANRQNLQSLDESCETWRVDLRNNGLGSAIVNRTEYFIEFNDAKVNRSSHKFDSILKELAKAGLIRNIDYWIKNITPGFSLSPKDDCFVFEIKTEHVGKLKRLDMILYFQGQLGDKYRREIFLTPRF